MPTRSIVENLDVVKDVGAGFGPRSPSGAVDELALERREEALDRRVVPAIAAATHAASDPAPAQLGAVRGAGVLAAAVGVDAGRGEVGKLTSAERDELQRLRRENQRLWPSRANPLRSRGRSVSAV